MARTHRGEADLTVALGNSPCDDERVLRVFADELSCAVVAGSEAVDRISANWPLGAFAAAASVAPIALEAAWPHIEAAAGLKRPERRRPTPGPPVALNLRDLFPDVPVRARPAGSLDLISGGAITNALLFILLRLPGFSLKARVIEGQDADLSNVSRYMLLRAAHQGLSKANMLEEASSGGIAISGIGELFTDESRGRLAPLAERVLVGVDNVEARWLVQQEWPEWLCIIPTISFVSFWAGLLQACELLSELERKQLARLRMVWPFALGGPDGLT